MKGPIEIGFKPKFIREMRKLSDELREEVKEAIRRFRDNPHDPALRVHKLKGRLSGSMSFSVNYAYRVVFEYERSGMVILLTVGDHDVYR